ncbi:polyamine-modulated factor 1-binding protein 1-like [Branchiostoma lanceolatum]|uniref:polyamine-modulated factor 1-binding protein 1-like n=1 Tax=Branchiostoma lanceolatum TaxID=7740 RepID=UPI00345115D4
MAGFVYNVVCAGLLVGVVYGAVVPTKPKYNNEKPLSSAQKVELLKEQLEELQKNLYKLSDTFSAEQEEEPAPETLPTQLPEKKPTTKPQPDPAAGLEVKNFVDSVATSLDKPREQERVSGNELTQEDVDFLQELKSFFKKKATQMVQETKEEKEETDDPDLTALANILSSNTRTVVGTLPKETEYFREGGKLMDRPYTVDELGDPNDVSKKDVKLSETKATTKVQSSEQEPQKKIEEAIAERLQADLREAGREGMTLEALLKQMTEDTERLNEESRRQALELQGKREPRAQTGEESLIRLVENKLVM